MYEDATDDSSSDNNNDGSNCSGSCKAEDEKGSSVDRRRSSLSFYTIPSTENDEDEENHVEGEREGAKGGDVGDEEAAFPYRADIKFALGSGNRRARSYCVDSDDSMASGSSLGGGGQPQETGEAGGHGEERQVQLQASHLVAAVLVSQVCQSALLSPSSRRWCPAVPSTVTPPRSDPWTTFLVPQPEEVPPTVVVASSARPEVARVAERLQPPPPRSCW